MLTTQNEGKSVVFYILTIQMEALSAIICKPTIQKEVFA